MRILIFGDSITQGFYDREGGWAGRLARAYHAQTLSNMLAGNKQDFETFNLGISGDMVEGLLKRFENEVKARRWADDPLYVVFAIGINDARLHENRAVNDVYEFQEVFEKVLDKAEDITDGMLVVGLSAVDEAQTNPWPYSRSNSQWTNTRINAFEDTLKQSAGHYNVPFVPVHDQFLAQLEAGADLLADGLHPNEAGHQLIAELVKPVLDEYLAKP